MFPRHFLIFSKVVEGWRILWAGFVVSIMSEVVLRAEVEPKEGVEASPGGSVL